MSEPIVERNIAPLAREIIAESPITVISGARQVGKSTLMRQLVAHENAQIVNLDATINRNAAQSDPDAFVRQYPEGTLAIDEIQRVPELLLAMKNALETDRRPGRFIVTGSSNLLTLQGTEESLAGRAQTLELRGFSRGELMGRSEDFASFAWKLPQTGAVHNLNDYSRRDYLEMATHSSYPELQGKTDRTRNRWLSAYVERIISKDVPEAVGIQHPDRLRPLLQLLATESASEFVAARYSRALDIPARTVPAYLQALVNVYLVDRLPAWSNNVAARTVSKPKTFLQDPGLAAFLSGVDIEGLEQQISSTLTGGLVEAFVAGELQRQRGWSEVDFTLRHFRDSQGREVDLVLENRARQIVGLEVKATTSVTRSHFKGLEYLRDKAGDRFIAGAVLHTGTQALPFGDHLWALPIATLWQH
ncbi:ATP-binding protein [Brevibacterium sp. 50QC2O2]|jgi:predicted AAA+ superfamily ATPase|uniref:ATP-binding protein n=1 Tax=Brevibacterium sp. 50QC2O2 TaxID=2968459 RepID=UPI00211BA262|nr:ATP-binding protein [Brevibacterium sp. 50QC2O2]MCQ9389439.1 ATP-binding protein [Brevibacterium sp. 50QC2O2]